LHPGFHDQVQIVNGQEAQRKKEERRAKEEWLNAVTTLANEEKLKQEKQLEDELLSSGVVVHKFGVGSFRDTHGVTQWKSKKYKLRVNPSKNMMTLRWPKLTLFSCMAHRIQNVVEISVDKENNSVVIRFEDPRNGSQIRGHSHLRKQK
jgi:hypothetical protein